MPPSNFFGFRHGTSPRSNTKFAGDIKVPECTERRVVAVINFTGCQIFSPRNLKSVAGVARIVAVAIRQTVHDAICPQSQWLSGSLRRTASAWEDFGKMLDRSAL